MRKFTNELKIGIFVVLALATGAFLWAKTQNYSADTYRLVAVFNYAGGLKENAPVNLSGIEVGRIEKLDFKYDPETKVEVTLSIAKKAKVYKDAIAYIGSTGFIGDCFIGLTPGTSKSGDAPDNFLLASEDPIEFRELMKKADSIAKKLDDTLVDVKKLAANLNGTVEENRGKIKNICGNLETTSANFVEFSDDIKQHPWKLLMKGSDNGPAKKK